MIQKATFFFITIFIISICPPGSLECYQGESLDNIIKKCRECRLFLINEEDIRGKLVNLNDESLEIEFHEKLPKSPFQIRTHRQTIPLEEILLLQCGDPAYDGAIAGFVIGGLSTALIAGIAISSGRSPYYEYDTSMEEIIARGLFIGGGIGAAVGFLLDIENGFRSETKDIREWIGERER
jgi:hypothetical protein